MTVISVLAILLMGGTTSAEDLKEISFSSNGSRVVYRNDSVVYIDPKDVETPLIPVTEIPDDFTNFHYLCVNCLSKTKAQWSAFVPIGNTLWLITDRGEAIQGPDLPGPFFRSDVRGKPTAWKAFTSEAIAGAVVRDKTQTEDQLFWIKRGERELRTRRISRLSSLEALEARIGQDGATIELEGRSYRLEPEASQPLSADVLKTTRPPPPPREFQAVIRQGPRIRGNRKRNTYSSPDLSQPKATAQVPSESGNFTTQKAWDVVQGFATNLGAEVLQNIERYRSIPLDPDLVEDAFAALCGSETRSLMVLGEPGVGKSTFVKALIARIVDGHGPAALSQLAILSTSANQIAAGTMWRGSTETRLSAMIALSRAAPILWVIDEFPSMRGTGTSLNDPNDNIERLKGAMTDGYLRVLGTGTRLEYYDMFAGDPAVLDRFATLFLDPLGREDSRRAADHWLAVRKRPLLTDPVFDRLWVLSEDYVTEGSQPRKIIQLVDYLTAAMTAEDRPTSPITLEDVEFHLTRKLGSDLKFDITAATRNLRTYLDSKLVGQDRAKSAFVEMAEVVAAGVHDRSRPKGRAILVGPEGQGKTEGASAFAAGLGLPFKRVSMNRFSAGGPFAVEALKAELVEAVGKSAAAVFLLDEFEKAPIALQEATLQVLDGGFIETAIQLKPNSLTTRLRRLDMRKSWVFIATNAGAQVVRDRVGALGFNPAPAGLKLDMNHLRESMISEEFSRYVLDRADYIIPFVPLTLIEFRDVIQIHARRILLEIESTTGTPIDVEDLEALSTSLARDHYSEGLSNREALRMLQQELRPAVARAILQVKTETEVQGVRVRIGQRTRQFESCAGLF